MSAARSTTRRRLSSGKQAAHLQRRHTTTRCAPLSDAATAEGAYTIIGAADEYGSGLTLDRPALQKVTEAVVAGRVDVVLVHSLTRIGREWGMTQRYIDLLTWHKVKLLCIRDRLLFDKNGAVPILTIKNAEWPL
ncbi:MAG: recombinase family protein [Evtepia sp.]|uniref:recombinase family protein n=1 Tax=Evtepia sp. TaxID=2773933 RepID=UPI002A749CA1|nr:recombinase family protein [Evtepia sp.]MDY3014773.1 recombinase family protein [Evtepia sp.]